MKIFLFLLSLLFSSYSYSQNGQVEKKWCSVGDNDTSVVDQGKFVEFDQNSNRLNDPDGLLIIPVVFHILYHSNNPAENISDQKIFEQVARLNADFRKLNSDIGLIPYGPWSDLAADFRIEFRLACIDPWYNPTNGINRVLTTNPNDFCGFSPPAPQQNIPCPDAQLPPPAGYGVSAWDTQKYLNIWVCSREATGGVAMLPWFRFGTVNLTGADGNTITYQRSQFDGIILDYRTVGENGGVPEFNKGRVGTHEVGHWLGLYHTYHGFCLGNGDEVPDTPPTYASIFCPLFPNLDGCSPGYPGTMYMNYMDYTQDDCKYMFTTDQKNRARSYFSQNGPYGTRYPFIENYFGIECPASTHIVQNNTITIKMKNPACLPVTYQYTGLLTVLSQSDHEIVFSIPCNSSGVIALSAASGNYIDNCTFSYLNQASCNSCTHTITPSGPFNVCTPWEWAPTNSILLTSTSTSSGQYQWYKDGQAIPGAISQTHNAQHEQQGIYIRTHVYTVADPIFSCSSLPVTINFVPTPLPPIEQIGFFSKGVWQTITTTENLSPATYTWNIPGAIISDANINDPLVDVFFPTSLPNSVTGNITINGGAPCANSTYTYEFLLSGNRALREPQVINEEKINNSNKIKLVPNPARNLITINSEEKIVNIELYNSSNILVIRKTGNSQTQVAITVQGLPGGIYSCKVYSKEGVQSLKLIIQNH